MLTGQDRRSPRDALGQDRRELVSGHSGAILWAFSLPSGHIGAAVEAWMSAAETLIVRLLMRAARSSRIQSHFFMEFLGSGWAPWCVSPEFNLMRYPESEANV